MVALTVPIISCLVRDAYKYWQSDVDHLDHLYVVREDWGRLYARGWWLLVPRVGLQLQMSRWSRNERATRGQKPSDITEASGAIRYANKSILMSGI